MQEEKKTRIIKLFFNIVPFIAGQYLKNFFILIHMLISNIPPETFAFVMVMIVAVVVGILKVQE